MGVRKFKLKAEAAKACDSVFVSKERHRPWTPTRQNLSYFVAPAHLRAHINGGVPLSKLPDSSYSSTSRLSPLRLYQGQLKEVKTKSTA